MAAGEGGGAAEEAALCLRSATVAVGLGPFMVSEPSLFNGCNALGRDPGLSRMVDRCAEGTATGQTPAFGGPSV